MLPLCLQAYCPAEKYDELYALAEKEQLPPFLDKLQAFVAKHPGPWAFGDSLTFCDFVLYELVDQIRLMFPDLFASRQEAWTPFLQDFEVFFFVCFPPSSFPLCLRACVRVCSRARV